MKITEVNYPDFLDKFFPASRQLTESPDFDNEPF